MLAAQIPDTPEAPETILESALVKIDWVAPFDQGSAITKYWVYMRESDAVTYSLPLGDCDHNLAALVTNTFCSVSVDVLRAAPFNLDWGDTLYA